MTEHSTLGQRAVCFQLDRVVLAVLQQFPLVKERVKLDLVDRGDYIGRLQQFLKVADCVVAYTIALVRPSLRSFIIAFQLFDLR